LVLRDILERPGEKTRVIREEQHRIEKPPDFENTASTWETPVQAGSPQLVYSPDGLWEHRGVGWQVHQHVHQIQKNWMDGIEFADAQHGEQELREAPDDESLAECSAARL
jgi:hypothetical protein